MPLAKQQDANTSIQIRTTPYTFELTQSHLGAADLKYTSNQFNHE